MCRLHVLQGRRTVLALTSFFKKKYLKDDEIIFYGVVDGVAEQYPVQRASKVLPDWWKQATKSYSNVQHPYGSTHIARCYGISDLLTTGFVVQLWHSVQIEHTREGDVQWSVPDNLVGAMQNRGYNIPAIDVLAKSAKMFPQHPHRASPVLKFNIPWRVVPPKGVKLLYIPLQYHPNIWYEASMGILDCEKNNDLNVNGFVTLPKGQKTILDAGTPIAQIIPLTEKRLKPIIRYMNETEKGFELKNELSSYGHHRPDFKTWGKLFRKTFYGEKSVDK